MTDGTDRVEQVNWLNQHSFDLTSNDWPGTPEEIVAFWISQVEADPDATMPAWFDEHDRRLLTTMVTEQL